MKSIHQAKSDLFEFLTIWPGYSSISKLMRYFPETEFFVSGGIVRDAFLGILHKSKDVDIFISDCNCDDIVAELSQSGEISMGSFGAYEWQPSAGNAVACDLILISKFFNGLWYCRDMLDVLNQFDCTVNALAVNLRNGDTMNPQNGLKDMASKTIRAVRFDYPDEPISEDASLTRNAVLWWRLLHYAEMLNFDIEPITLAWLARNQSYEACRGEFEREFHPIKDKALLLIKT